MLKQRIFFIATIFFAILAVMHYVGTTFHIYYSYKWFDIPVHIVAGIWISLTVFWLLPYVTKDYSIKNYRIKSILVGLISVLGLSLVWEISELARGLTSMSDKVFWADTSGDFLSAIIGFVIGLVYFLNQKKCANGICELVKPTTLSNLK
jgi:hypothetical protein